MCGNVWKICLKILRAKDLNVLPFRFGGRVSCGSITNTQVNVDKFNGPVNTLKFVQTVNCGGIFAYLYIFVNFSIFV